MADPTKNLSEADIEAMFENMLEEMNLNDMMKEPLRKKGIDQKKAMIMMHQKGCVQQSRLKFTSGQDYIHYLQNHKDAKSDKLMNCLESLRIALSSNPLSWVKEFGKYGGLEIILDILETKLHEPTKDGSLWRATFSTGSLKLGKEIKIKREILLAISKFMNNSEGFRTCVEHPTAFTTIARCLDAKQDSVMVEACRLMAAASIVQSQDGRSGSEKMLLALTRASAHNRRPRFEQIVLALQQSDNELLRIATLQLVNSLIGGSEDLDFRMHVRNEIMRAGFRETFEHLVRQKDQEEQMHNFNNKPKLTNGSSNSNFYAINVIQRNPTRLSKDLLTQLNCFIETKDSDFDEFAQRFENLCIDINDPRDGFHALYESVKGTPVEDSLLSIIQHLLLIRDDPYAKPAYYRLIEEAITQIVLHKSGYDPDFEATKRFQIDVDDIIQQMVHRSQMEEEKVAAHFNKKLEEMTTAKIECDARIHQLEDEITRLKRQLSEGGGASAPPTPPRNSLAGQAPGPSLPPKPGIYQSINPPPPPPPMPGNGRPPFPGSGCAPPPPPPPMPGMGMAPPPPPPPMPGMGGPPPPPPPPGMGGMRMPPPFGQPGANNNVLPFGLKPKPRFEGYAKTTMKRPNWKTITPTKLTESSFWVKVDEEKLADDDILNELASQFSSDNKRTLTPMEDSNQEFQRIPTMKKKKDPKVIDPKTAQSLSILMRSYNMSPEELQHHILTMNKSKLSEAMLQQLIKYMPSKDQIKRLEEFRGNMEELDVAEALALTLGSIRNLENRLKSTSFEMKFEELVQDVHPDLIHGTAACDEVKKSPKFAKILQLILLFGNFMSSGIKNGQAYGFEISSLPKLRNTKAADNKTTLIHFLAKICEQKHPDALDFYEEIAHVNDAARVNKEQLEKNLNQMRKAIKDLDNDLKTFKPQNQLDRFGEVMTPFLIKAKAEFEKLQSMFQRMDRLYNELAQYYAFDPKKYPMDEFFNDIKTFKDQFIDAHKENVKLREEEEKQKRRAKELQEKKMKDMQEKENVKRRQKFSTDGPEQEGLMDSLLEAINSGQAFRGNRRRNPRPVMNPAERRAQLSRSRSRGSLENSLSSASQLSSKKF